MKSRVQLFTDSDEILFLAVPIFFVLGAALLWLLGWTDLTSSSEKVIDAIIMTVGMQEAHKVFTFALLALPESRQWLTAQRQLQHKNLLLRWAITGALLFVVFWFLYGYADQLRSASGGGLHGISAWKFFWLAFYYVNFGHTLGQTYGLSMLYNRAYLDSLPTGERAAARVLMWMNIERRVYKPFLWSMAIYAAYWQVFSYDQWSSYAIAPGVLAIAAVMLPTFFLPAPLRRAKLWFNVRLLLYLVLFFPGVLLLGFGLNVVHNLEYWNVLKSSAGNSRLANKRWYWAMSALGFALFVLLALPRNSGFFVAANAWFVAHMALRDGLIAATLAMTALHYLMDGDIFHFSDPMTRKFILPLLSSGARRIDEPVKTSLAS
jgi:hypothetical protein